MKRYSNLFDKIISPDNLKLAAKRAMKGKSEQYGVKLFLRNRSEKLFWLHWSLATNSFRTSKYKTFTIREPKEREIFALPFYPDRIVHHAIMVYLEPRFNSLFTADTYSCIKGRGIHGAANAVRSALKNVDQTTYCLKLDIRKFYPSVDHVILKQLLRRKFNDANLMKLIDEIIDSACGVPIGNYLSQYFANFYLTGFDHWIKEEAKVKYYFRYADDMVILSDSKEFLHDLLAKIRYYLHVNLNLDVKDNHQVFPVAARGIDFVGYVFYHTHVKLRKTIKKRFARMLKKRRNRASIASYNGWTTHCDSHHLKKKLLYEII